MNLATTFESLACVTSTLAIATTAIAMPQRLTSNQLFLPLYTAGMVQWGLYGLWADNPLITVTSVIQVLICLWLLSKWWRLVKA